MMGDLEISRMTGGVLLLKLKLLSAAAVKFTVPCGLPSGLLIEVLTVFPRPSESTLPSIEY